MLENINTNETLRLKEITEEEKKRRGILGILYGPVASVVKATRNGRKYTEELWEKAFQDPIVNEMFNNGGLILQFEHPQDSTDTMPERIAAMMPEKPKKDKQGRLCARIDLLDTVCGRLAYTLAKYGFKLGISSRGEGDVISGYDGEELVDPDSYQLTTWDLVCLPAVKEARLELVNESLDKQKLALKKALTEALNASSDEDKKLMLETLQNLNISLDYTHDADADADAPVSEVNIDNSSNSTTTLAAEDAGATLVKELQETLKKNKSLQDQLKILQEQLSVCYTKESKYVEAVNACKTTLTQYKKKVEELTEGVSKSESQVRMLTETLATNKKVIMEQGSKIIDLVQKGKKESKSLNENLSQKDDLIKIQGDKIKTLTESINALKIAHVKETQILKESIEELKNDSVIKKNEYNKKLSRQIELVERYKLIAKTAVEKYIAAQASKLGINTNDIKSKLNENYSFNDIDRVCESFKNYNLNISKLPFPMSNNSSVRVNMKGNRDPIVPKTFQDDDIDSQLLAVANLDKI